MPIRAAVSRDATPHRPSLTGFLKFSTGEILLYRTLYFSKKDRTAILAAEGMSITIATTAPRLKSGTLPSISSYKTEATTSYWPPTEAGIPKSVNARKKDWIKEAARVPVRGRSTVIRNV